MTRISFMKLYIPCLMVAAISSPALAQAAVLDSIPLPLPIECVKAAVGDCEESKARDALKLYQDYLEQYHVLYSAGCAQALPALYTNEFAILMPHSSEEAARANSKVKEVQRTLAACTSQFATSLVAGMSTPDSKHAELIREFELASMRRDSMRSVAKLSPGVTFDLPGQLGGLILNGKERADVAPVLDAHLHRVHQLLREVHNRNMSAFASVARYLEALGFTPIPDGRLFKPNHSLSRPDVEAAWRTVSRRILLAAAAVEEENWSACNRVTALLSIPNQLRLRVAMMTHLLDGLCDGAIERELIQTIRAGSSGSAPDLAREILERKQPLLDAAALAIRTSRSNFSFAEDFDPQVLLSPGPIDELRRQLQAIDAEFELKLHGIGGSGAAPPVAQFPFSTAATPAAQSGRPESSELVWASRFIVSGRVLVPQPMDCAHLPNVAAGNQSAIDEYLASYQSSRPRWSQLLNDAWRSFSEYESCDPSIIVGDTPVPNVGRACKVERQVLESVWAVDLEWLQKIQAVSVNGAPADLPTWSARFEFLTSRCNPLGSDPLDSFGTPWRADLGAIALQELGGSPEAITFAQRFYEQLLPLLEERQRALLARREAEMAQRLGVQFSRALILRPEESSIPTIGGKMLQDCKDQRAELSARHQSLRQAHLRVLRSEESLFLELKLLAGPRAGRVSDRRSGTSRSLVADQAVSKAISIMERNRKSDLVATQKLDRLLSEFINIDSTLVDAARECDAQRLESPAWEECADDFAKRQAIELADLRRAVELDWIAFERTQRLTALEWVVTCMVD